MTERSYALKVFFDPNGPFFLIRDYEKSIGFPLLVKRFASLEEARAAGAKQAPWSFEVVDFDEASNIAFLKDHLSHV